MASLVSEPLLPDAWLKISSPVLLTATKTKPGILLGSEVASSMAMRDVSGTMGVMRRLLRYSVPCRIEAAFDSLTV